MGELRAYALGVPELTNLLEAGASARAAALRNAAEARFGQAVGPTLGEMLGPIHRRVPGTAVVRGDDPTRADLEALVARTPVAPARAAATWRLVEALVADLAADMIELTTDHRPPSALRPLDLELPPAPHLTAGWCALEAEAELTAIDPRLARWADQVVRSTTTTAPGRSRPDVVVFWSP